MSTTNPIGSSSAPPDESRHASLKNISSNGNNDEPWHDVLPKNIFWRLLYKALCMTAVSEPSLEHWRHLVERPIQQEWVEHKQMVVNRFENMNVTAGLVLTTSAVFISTAPPFQPLMPYASHGSYILQLSSFIAALISLMTGTSVLIIYDTCYANERVLKSLMQSRSRRICCLILMAYPSLALAVSTFTLMTAFFIAGSTSDKLFVKILISGTYLTLLFLAALAIHVFSGHLKDVVIGKDNDSHITDGQNPPSSEPQVVRDSGHFHRKSEHPGSDV